MPVISVIVPVYNVEKYLHRCVDSILVQTFTDFELILVDDGSPDNCGIICDEYAEKDNRIHVIHKENGGLSDARNAGIDWTFVNSSSEWITFIDSDDWVHPNYLKDLFESRNVLEGCKLVICKHFVSHGEDISYNDSFSKWIYEPDEFRSELAEYATCSVAKLYKKELFDTIRFPVGRLNEDVFTIYKLIFSVNKLVFIDVDLYAYYQRESSIMRSNWTSKKLDALDAFNEQIQFFYNQGHIKSYKRAIIAYANTVIDQINNCQEYGTDDKNAPKMLKKLLRKHMRKYKKEKVFSIKLTPQYYDYAYPSFMKYYWIVKAQIEKIKR